MSTFEDFYNNYYIFVIVLLFVIVYLIFNYDLVKQGIYNMQDFAKPIIITAIIALILHIMMRNTTSHTSLTQPESLLNKSILKAPTPPRYVIANKFESEFNKHSLLFNNNHSSIANDNVFVPKPKLKLGLNI